MKKSSLLSMVAAITIFAVACSQPMGPSPDAVEPDVRNASRSPNLSSQSVSADNPAASAAWYTVDLLAGRQGVRVGEVAVRIKGHELWVTYTTGDGWQLSDINLWVGDDLSDMPQAGNSGNPLLRRFPHRAGGIEETAYTITVCLAKLGDDLCGKIFKVAAHAEVEKPRGRGAARQREDAWADGERISELGRGLWATYFAFQFECVEYAIGDIGPAGGEVFYRSMEALRVEGWYPWGGYGYEVGEAAQGWGIGEGAANTAAIVAAYGDAEPYEGRSDYAAKVADDLIVEHNGRTYEDWFLPSAGEVKTYLYNLHYDKLGTEIYLPWFWTSTESTIFWPSPISCCWETYPDECDFCDAERSPEYFAYAFDVESPGVVSWFKYNRWAMARLLAVRTFSPCDEPRVVAVP